MNIDLGKLPSSKKSGFMITKGLSAFCGIKAGGVNRSHSLFFLFALREVQRELQNRAGVCQPVPASSIPSIRNKMHYTLAKQKASCFQACHKQVASLNVCETVLLENMLLGILISFPIFLHKLLSIKHQTFSKGATGWIKCHLNQFCSASSSSPG